MVISSGVYATRSSSRVVNEQVTAVSGHLVAMEQVAIPATGQSVRIAPGVQVAVYPDRATAQKAAPPQHSGDSWATKRAWAALWSGDIPSRVPYTDGSESFQLVTRINPDGSVGVIDIGLNQLGSYLGLLLNADGIQFSTSVDSISPDTEVTVTEVSGFGQPLYLASPRPSLMSFFNTMEVLAFGTLWLAFGMFVMLVRTRTMPRREKPNYQPAQAPALETLLLLLEAIPHPVVIFSANEQVVFANERARSDLGWTSETLGDESVVTIVGPSYRAISTEVTCAPRIPAYHDAPNYPDHKVAIYHYETFGRRTYCAVFSRPQAVERAEVVPEAMLGHELRNSLNGVLGAISLLRATQIDEEQQGHIDLLEYASHTTLDLVNNLIDYSRGADGAIPVEYARMNVRELLQRVAETLMVGAKAKGLAFTLDVEESVPAEIVSDRRRLRQILLNLGSNALKFTQTGAVSLKVERYPGAQLKLSITDTGPGIPEELLGRLFSPYSQGQTRARAQGLGLGLYISRSLAEGMHGSLSVKSRVNEGSCFSLVVPLRIPRVKGVVARGLSPATDEHFLPLSSEDRL